MTLTENKKKIISFYNEVENMYQDDSTVDNARIIQIVTGLCDITETVDVPVEGSPELNDLRIFTDDLFSRRLGFDPFEKPESFIEQNEDIVGVAFFLRNLFQRRGYKLKSDDVPNFSVLSEKLLPILVSPS